MMSRRMKTLLPTTNNLLAPRPSDVHYKDKHIIKHWKQEHYYNRYAELPEGQCVRVQNKPGTKAWEKATVTEVLLLPFL